MFERRCHALRIAPGKHSLIQIESVAGLRNVLGPTLGCHTYSRAIDLPYALKLLFKFNLIFLGLFGSGLVATAFLADRFLKDDARSQVVRQAELMMETAHATRTYTSQDVVPLLERRQAQTQEFLPQTVPAFAATSTFTILRKQHPEYTYKEASLNPTNLVDRAVDWEADIINAFRNHPEQKQIIGERDTPSGRALYLAAPIRADRPCLECHSIASVAPRAMVRTYGTANGFGWRLGTVVAAQIVSVPMTVPEQIASSAFRTLLIYLGITALVTLAIVDLALVMLVIRPVTRLAHMADRISRGEMDLPEIPAQGRDEVSELTRSFNRMYVSMQKALRLLGS